ncbi:MAG TPA: DUF2946 family protein [Janthinobacterium sp.]|jgi:hypothetical protein|nr:DUF2946 family protein [Janthinobacterium sp.]
MRKIDLQQRVFLSFVILTILAMLLAPSMLPPHLQSQPKLATAGGNAVYAELCSADDIKRQDPGLRDSGKSTPDDCHSQSGHCMFCSSAVDPVVPSISPPVLHLLTFGLAYLPALFEHGPHTMFAWAPSQARAPPSPLNS